MKKKVLSIALVVAVVAMMVGGTLAYFTAEDDVTNTFTVGSVKIEIWENGTATTDDTITFTEPLTPVVNSTPSLDINYIDKIIKVENTGANAAYIRTHLAVPTKLVEYLMLDVSADWNFVRETAAGDYTVYTYDYMTAVNPAAFTPDLLKGVYLASDVDLEEGTDGNLYFVKKTNGTITHQSGYMAHEKTANGYTSKTVSVLVASQAVQAQGFESNTATEALDAAFGSGNPWQ